MTEAPFAVRVADVELGRPIEPADGLDGYAALRAVVRLGGVPVAEATVPAVGGRVEAGALADRIATYHTAELTRHLLRRWLARPADAAAPRWEALAEGGDVAALLDCPEPPGPPLPPATVAVCTRDRPEDLARCLAALAALDHPAYDVLVVDNAPRTDATEALVRGRAARGDRVRYVREPRPGLDWARNRAIAETRAAGRAELLAFTDDDVVPDPGWLRAAARVFAASPAAMAVTGMIAPAELETRAQVDFEAYGGFGHGWARRWVRRPRRAGLPDAWHHAAGWLGTGANMAFRVALFDRLGGFDPALDTGTETQGGGDLEMLFRVVQEGHLLVYAPEALVRHRHRRGADELRRQLATWGRGFHAHVRRSRRAYPEESRAFDRLARRWWGDYVLRAVAAGALGGGSVEAALRPYEALGALRGARAYDRAARHAAGLLARYPGEPTVLPAPSAPRGAGPASGAEPARTVAVDGPLAAGLDDVGEAVRVRVAVTAGGRPAAEATAVPEPGGVSAAQLRDAVAAALTERLLTERWHEVHRSLAGWLGAG